MEKTSQSLNAKDKQIAKLEADLNEKSSQITRLINEKLKLIAGIPRETTEHNGPPEEHAAEPEVREVQSKHKPTGETL